MARVVIYFMTVAAAALVNGSVLFGLYLLANDFVTALLVFLIVTQVLRDAREIRKSIRESDQ